MKWLPLWHPCLPKIYRGGPLYIYIYIYRLDGARLDALSNILDGPVALLLLTVQNIKLAPKTFTENWDSKAPSVGTLLAYLEI